MKFGPWAALLPVVVALPPKSFRSGRHAHESPPPVLSRQWWDEITGECRSKSGPVPLANNTRGIELVSMRGAKPKEIHHTHKYVGCYVVDNAEVEWVKPAVTMARLTVEKCYAFCHERENDWVPSGGEYWKYMGGGISSPHFVHEGRIYDDKVRNGGMVGAGPAPSVVLVSERSSGPSPAPEEYYMDDMDDDAGDFWEEGPAPAPAADGDGPAPAPARPAPEPVQVPAPAAAPAAPPSPPYKPPPPRYSQRLQYFLLRNGNECGCLHYLNKNPSGHGEEKCTYKCDGSDEETCGGAQNWSVHVMIDCQLKPPSDLDNVRAKQSQKTLDAAKKAEEEADKKKRAEGGLA